MGRWAVDLARFYDALTRLEQLQRGPHTLSACTGRMEWPERGVYFFFEPGETRRDTGDGPRVVRVGTHALKAGARSSLWGRLSQHKGSASSGGGNHRGSIFRLIVGAAIKRREGSEEPASWGIGSDAGQAAKRLGIARAAVKERELALEREVGVQIGAMPFVYLSVEDPPGPESLRGLIERNSIALLSNYRSGLMGSGSPGWLGLHSGRERVVRSGLWNNNHVDEDYDPAFLDSLDELIRRARAG